MLSAWLHAMSVMLMSRCLFGKNRSLHRGAPNAGMRCGLPASSRQCGRCLGWSSTMRRLRIRRNQPNASPIPTTEVASTDAGDDIPCFVPHCERR